MKTIDQKVEHEIIVKNSRFICILIPLLEENIQEILDSYKKEYPKATHYCYAYVFDGKNHSSDDGEPGGTAGMPILNVLEKEDLNRVLCVVIRYFGGIKLGAGGLVRAYTKSVTETLKIASFSELIPGFVVSINFPYEEEKNIQYILQQSEILEKEYLETITYTCLVPLDALVRLEKYQPTILKPCFIKDSSLDD